MECSDSVCSLDLPTNPPYRNDLLRAPTCLTQSLTIPQRLTGNHAQIYLAKSCAQSARCLPPNPSLLHTPQETAHSPPACAPCVPSCPRSGPPHPRRNLCRVSRYFIAYCRPLCDTDPLGLDVKDGPPTTRPWVRRIFSSSTND